MTIMKFNRYILSAIVAGFIALPASAAQPVAEEPGISGFFQLGVGLANVESNFLAKAIGADLGDDTTDDLTAPADSEISGIPLLGLSVTYTFKNKSTEIFFGSSVEDFVQFDFASSLGLRQQAGNAGIFELSVLSTPVATEVWEDPYATGVSREETDRESDGARLEWGAIMGSGFDVSVSTREIDIDQERSGDALVAATTITAGEQALLDRNGDVNTASIAYNWDIEQGRMSFSVNAVDRDLDGEAMAHDGVSVQLTHTVRLSPRTRLVSNILLGKFEFDEDNPIYDEEDEMDTVGLSVNAFVNDPFGYKGWVSSYGFAFAQEDHDLDFYDTDVALISFAMIRQF